MQITDIPQKFQLPFGGDASGSYLTYPIPLSGAGAGRASLQTGFPPTTFVPVAGGGNPPWGADVNGILYWSTRWLQWAQAGGLPGVYDSAFATAVGGYPAGAMLRATTLGNGRYWISLVDNNTSNPDALPIGGAGTWMPFPDVAVQRQAGNYAVDNGSVNAAQIALYPAPTTWASIVGSPIRFKIKFTNTTTTPTVRIGSISAATMVNADGTALAVGQLPAKCIVDGLPRDDGTFQVNAPAKSAATISPFKTGFIYICPFASLSGLPLLECAGSIEQISTYPSLYSEIGTTFGGDGVDTFGIPDYRGYFLRGWDHGAGRDLGPRTAGPGGVTGDNIGSVEASTAGNIVFDSVLATLAPQTSGSPNADPLFNLVFASEATTVAGFVNNFQYSGPVAHAVKISLNTNVGSGETRGINVNPMFAIAY